ncbi:MAG: hypothetical protein EBW19_03250 [Betaproteobacteria bacterium]|nr:hypothetical protein [Betaproteobacteria bacterium]
MNTNKEQQVAALQGLKLISAKRQVQTSRVIALSPKSNAVECATLKDVVAALQVIRAAVEGGELDTQITQASERLREGFKE